MDARLLSSSKTDVRLLALEEEIKEELKRSPIEGADVFEGNTVLFY